MCYVSEVHVSLRLTGALPLVHLVIQVSEMSTNSDFWRSLRETASDLFGDEPETLFEPGPSISVQNSTATTHETSAEAPIYQERCILHPSSLPQQSAGNGFSVTVEDLPRNELLSPGALRALSVEETGNFLLTIGFPLTEVQRLQGEISFPCH